MRLSVLFAVTTAIAFAQSQSASTTVITDLNGNRVTAASSTSTSTATDHTQTKLTQNLNGRQVPLEQIEEHVLRSDSTGKVTERIVRFPCWVLDHSRCFSLDRFDPTCPQCM